MAGPGPIICCEDCSYHHCDQSYKCECPWMCMSQAGELKLPHSCQEREKATDQAAAKLLQGPVLEPPH